MKFYVITQAYTLQKVESIIKMYVTRNNQQVKQKSHLVEEKEIALQLAGHKTHAQIHA